MIAEQSPGEWSLVKVGLTPSDAPSGEATEERAKPDYAEDPLPAQHRTAHLGY
jgi:hypothetical protein